MLCTTISILDFPIFVIERGKTIDRFTPNKGRANIQRNTGGISAKLVCRFVVDTYLARIDKPGIKCDGWRPCGTDRFVWKWAPERGRTGEVDDGVREEVTPDGLHA